MKLVIDRKQWRRGETSVEQKLNDPTSLLCKDGTKCCLGFYALQCGFTPEQIKGLGEPIEVYIDYNEVTKDWEKLVRFIEDEEFGTMDTSGTMLTSAAIDINDDILLSEEDREARLTAVFAKEGIEVEFHG